MILANQLIQKCQILFFLPLQILLHKENFIKTLYDDKIKLAIFDFDGTIADTLQCWKNVDKRFFGKRNITYDPKDYFDKIIGLGLYDCAKFTVQQFNLKETPDQVFNEWQEIYNEIMTNEVDLFPGAIELFKLLQNLNIKIAIASACPKKLIQSIINNATQKLQKEGISQDTKANVDDILSLIETIQCCDEVGKNKPDPTVFLKCNELLNISPSQTIIFEDSISGLQGAQNAKPKHVILHLSDNYKAQEKKQYCDYYVNNLLQITE